MEAWLKRIIWLVAGTLFVFTAAAAAATGSFQPGSFYDAGEVDEIYPFVLQAEGQGLSYLHAGDDFFTVTDDMAAEYLLITKKTWKYVIIDVSHLNTESLTLDFTACDEAWNPIETQSVTVKEGKEIFSYELSKCNNLLLGIQNQKGTQFRFNQLQFRKKLFYNDKKKIMLAGMLALFLYAGLSAGAVFLKRKKRIDVFFPFKKAAGRCFSLYMEAVGAAANCLYRAAGGRMAAADSRIKSAVRIFALASWIVAEMFLRGMGLRSKIIPFHYAAALAVLFLFAVTSLERPLKRPGWNHALVYAWVSLSVIMTIAGVMEPKKWPGAGLLFLSAYAVWFYIWGNMRNPRIVLADITYALKTAFWLTAALSVLGRTYIPGQPYSGIYNNQNVFVSFLVMLLAVDLSQILNLYRDGNMSYLKGILLSAEMCLLLFFLLGTQSRGGLLTGLAVIAVFFFRCKRKFLFLIQALLLFFPVSYTAEWTIVHVQEAFPARIEFVTAETEEDNILDDGRVPGETAYAAESGNHLSASLKAKSLDALTSGRVTLWKAYIRNMNLWGHYNKEYTNGVSIHPHNAFLYIAYLYGILALAPYCAMWYMIFGRAVRYEKNKTPYSFLPLALATGFFAQAMTDTLEEPFAMECWIIVYIVIGILFGDVCGTDEKSRL